MYYGFKIANWAEQAAWFHSREAAERFNAACGGGLGEVEAADLVDPSDVMDTLESPWADEGSPSWKKRMHLTKPFRIEDNLHRAPSAMPALFRALSNYVDWWSKTSDDDLDPDDAKLLYNLMEDATEAMGKAGWTTEHEAAWDGERYRCGHWSSVDGVVWNDGSGALVGDLSYQDASIRLNGGPENGRLWQMPEAILFPIPK